MINVKDNINDKVYVIPFYGHETSDLFYERQKVAM